MKLEPFLTGGNTMDLSFNIMIVGYFVGMSFLGFVLGLALMRIFDEKN